jgi:hypothetical protein
MDLTINLYCQPSPRMSGGQVNRQVEILADEAGQVLSDEAGNVLSPDLGIPQD